MRPSWYLFTFVVFMCATDVLFFTVVRQKSSLQQNSLTKLVTVELGLSDLAVATEARYTRHPTQSDPLVPYMDHPGAIEHFPTGSFWRPLP